LAARELAGLSLRFVVNLTRLRGDADLGPAMTDMARRYLGVALDCVGSIEQDDAVWLSVVRRQPLLTDSPASKSARNLERIARRVLALATTRSPEPSATLAALGDEELSLYEILGTHRGATDEELRRAYKRQRDIYEPGSLALTSLLTDDELETERSRVEEAHDTLLDPLRRRAYDISTFTEAEQREPAADTARSAAEEAERAMLREELGREINAETEFTGRLLRKVRESRGVEIEEIANRTKISSAHLRAIEAEDFSSLPAPVYTRGFVQQVARYLQLDPTQVARTYLRRMREWRAATEQGSS
jgi:flagellar biosynthesis protein FlhG